MRRSFNKYHPVVIMFIQSLIMQSCVFDMSQPLTGVQFENRQKENFYYTPTPHNTPALSKKNEMSASIVHAYNSDYNATSLMAAWMPADHIGVMGSISLTGNNSSNGNTGFKQQELGIGYIKELSSKLLFETYAGAGFGKLKNNHYTGHSTFNTSHVFLQPSVVFIGNNPVNRLILSSKFSMYHYRFSDSLFYNQSEVYTLKQIQLLMDQPSHLLWEPGIDFRFGWKHVQFDLSAVYSVDLKRNDMNRKNYIMSAGIRFVNIFDKRSK